LRAGRPNPSASPDPKVAPGGVDERGTTKARTLADD